MNNYIELNVQVSPKEQGTDILIAELSEIGFESFVENELGFLAYINENDYNTNEVESLFSAFKNDFTINYTNTKIEQQNWNKEWESNFEPIDVVGKCYIRAPFHEAKPHYSYEVIIEPKMSFGTGHHATTQLMIQQLMLLNVKNKSLLDMGCGTGVLAIVASMMGANPITAIDIDDWSIENSIENAAKNNINNIHVHKGNAQILEGKTFNTILANINKNVLLADIPTYSTCLEKQGNLVLSGFFETDVQELTEIASKVGLKFESKMVNNQWTMLHFIKL